MQRIKKILQKHPFFLFLLPLFIVIHIEKQHSHLINYGYIYKEIIILFTVPVITYVVCFAFSRSYLKAAIQSLIILFAFYFFGDIKDYLNRKFEGHFLQSYTFLIPVMLGLTLGCLYIVRKKKAGFGKATLFINILLIFFIIGDITSIVFEKRNQIKKSKILVSSFTHCSDCTNPDIYYFIFDSYSSSAILRQEFNFNNAAIDSQLTRKGFKILSRSKSNYNLTPFSIGSTFNMEYLPGTDTTTRYFLKNYLPAVQVVYANQLVPILEKEGYLIFNHSIFNFNSHPSSIPSFDIWEIASLYKQYNLFSKIYDDIGWQFPSWLKLPARDPLKEYSKNRDGHDSSALMSIINTASNSSQQPKFVYGHIFLPHSPYTFNAQGEKIEPVHNMSIEEDKAAYVQQVIYTNEIIKKLVDTVFINQKRAFIIIIQGDHGYRFFDKSKKYLEFPNFNAVYFSNKDYHLLNDSLTNVNLFRVVFNTFFKQNYPMLDDHVSFLKYK